MAEHCSRYSGSINLMVMLGFFTSTAMQRLFSMQTTVPGTAKSITIFISSLKPDLLEVREFVLVIDFHVVNFLWCLQRGR